MIERSHGCLRSPVRARHGLSALFQKSDNTVNMGTATNYALPVYLLWYKASDRLLPPLLQRAHVVLPGVY